jgi:hypothetical protein
MPRRDKGIVRFKVTGLANVRRAVRGLGDPNVVNMSDMNKRAATIFRDQARIEAPKRTHALEESGDVSQGRGFTYNATFGGGRVDYVPAVLVGAGKGERKANHFLARAKKKTFEKRKEVYAEGMAKVIAARKLNRRR